MKACLLRAPADICTNPLIYADVTLPPRKSPVIPGHHVVGEIEALGEGARRFRVGARVGIAWLHRTDGVCEFCRAGAENLCDDPSFSGYSVDGGYAEYAVAHEDFVYAIPDSFADEQAAPLLCAGIIGFRCLRLSGVHQGSRLGFYGFGSAAHVAIQVARHWGVEVFASTRGEKHQRLARELGAVWAGDATAEPPAKLDAAIIFAPAGEIVPAVLKALKKGGVLVLGGRVAKFHMRRLSVVNE
jgi:propanol-preferring alcohol dehydrogenase